MDHNNYTVIEDIFDDKNRDQMRALSKVRPSNGVPEAFRNPPIPRQDMLMEHHQPQPHVHPHHRKHQQEEIEMILPRDQHIHCIDAFTHMEECALCSSYFKKDIKFYWFIIFILLIIIILLASKMYDKNR